MQRILQHVGQFDGLVFAVIEQSLEALLRADAHMMVALRADHLVLFQFLGVDHLRAVRTFGPQVVGRVLLAGDLADLRQDGTGHPVHRSLPSLQAAALATPCTASASSRTSASPWPAGSIPFASAPATPPTS